MAGSGAAVTEMQRRHIVRMTGDREHRPSNRSPAITNFHDGAVNLSALAAGKVRRAVPPSRAIVAGLTSTALSHVRWVSGFGSSCSQALLLKRPS